MIRLQNALYLIVLLIFGASCGLGGSSQDGQFSLIGNEHLLEGGRTSVLLPANLKASSRYRIGEDIPHLQEDSLLLLMTQNTLHALEFEDESIDLFVSTEGPFHQLIIMDMQMTPLNKTNGSILASSLREQYQSIADRRPEFEVEKISSQLQQMKQRAYLKIKYLIRDQESGRALYNTHYVLTTTRQTYMIYELTTQEYDIEPYLWTWKEF